MTAVSKLRPEEEQVAIGPGRKEDRPTKIHFQNVAKSFRSELSRTVVLDGIDLKIAKGDFVSILGESGCGKTTLLRIAGGLIPPSRGTVAIDGQVIAKPTRDMGFVFQQSVLLEWRTVIENVLLPIEIFGLPTSLSGSTALFITHDIAEATYLSDRVVVLASRPGRVKKIFDIDLPRPRLPEHRFDERFVTLCREMKHCMTE